MPICSTNATKLQRQIVGLRERNVNDAAAVVLDNASGAVLHMSAISAARPAPARSMARQHGASRSDAWAVHEPRAGVRAGRYSTPASLPRPARWCIWIRPVLYAAAELADKNFHGTVKAPVARWPARSTCRRCARCCLHRHCLAFNLLQQLGFTRSHNGDHYGFAPDDHHAHDPAHGP